MTDDELQDFRMPRPPWADPDHDVAGDFRRFLTDVESAASVWAREAAPPVTMESFQRAIDLLRGNGFPHERPTVQCGDVEAFRRWAMDQVPMVKDTRLALAASVYGMPVLADVTLPPNVIEIREGNRVLSRAVLPPSTP